MVNIDSFIGHICSLVFVEFGHTYRSCNIYNFVRFFGQDEYRLVSDVAQGVNLPDMFIFSRKILSFLGQFFGTVVPPEIEVVIAHVGARADQANALDICTVDNVQLMRHKGS
jgi:hypothetical protein